VTPAATARRATAPARRPRPAEAPPRRPPLRVVGDEPQRGHARRRRAALLLSAALVVGSLLSVVVGHAVLAEGQVRLTAAEAAVATAQATEHQETLTLATLESPSRIVAEAKVQLHMVPAGQIVQLPHVPLATPLPTPTVAPAPATPAGQ